MITSLKGANVVVLGGSRSLGRIIVTAAHREGAHVLAVARQLELSRSIVRPLPGMKHSPSMRPAKTRQ